MTNNHICRLTCLTPIHFSKENLSFRYNTGFSLEFCGFDLIDQLLLENICTFSKQNFSHKTLDEVCVSILLHTLQLKTQAD